MGRLTRAGRRGARERARPGPGEGEEEGWELAERDLIENATHGDGYGNPIRDALTPEVESDASTVDYGEPDDLPEPW